MRDSLKACSWAEAVAHKMRSYKMGQATCPVEALSGTRSGEPGSIGLAQLTVAVAVQEVDA